MSFELYTACKNQKTVETISTTKLIDCQVLMILGIDFPQPVTSRSTIAVLTDKTALRRFHLTILAWQQ